MAKKNKQTKNDMKMNKDFKVYVKIVHKIGSHFRQLLLISPLNCHFHPKSDLFKITSKTS